MNDKIALISLCVASFSFALTVITILQTRKHNRLMVKPLFKLISYDAEDYIAIFILNAGTGPLIREKLTVSNGTKTANCLIDLMPKNIIWSNFSKFPDFIITPNQKETLIEISGNATDIEFNKKKAEIREALKDIKLVCYYRNIYGEKFKSDEITLGYCYGRHFKK